MADHPSAVAVLGLGIMGAPFARNLGRAGLRARAWSRSPEPRQAVAGSPGVIVARTSQDATSGAGAVITMLSDAAATVEVVASVLDTLAPGALIVQMATIGLEGTAELVSLLARRRPDIVLIDAPVSGTKGPAEAGTVTILASGPADLAVGDIPAAVATRLDLAEFQPAADDAAASGPPDPAASVDPADRVAQRELLGRVFDAIGARTVWLGEAGAGSRMKLIVNTLLAFVTHGLAEAVLLAEGLGVSAGELWETLDGAPIASPFMRGKLAKFGSRDFAAEMSLRWGTKDIGLALAANASRPDAVELPALAELEQIWSQAVAAGLGSYDISALLAHLETGGL